MSPYYRPKIGPRKGQEPAITVPRSMKQCTYLNVPLVKRLNELGITKVAYTLNLTDKTIELSVPNEGQKGFAITRTGKRGWGITPKFRKKLPAGRYVLYLDSGESFLFGRK